MNPLVRVWTVAGFEFLRVWKPRDLIVTLAMFVSGALFYAWLKSGDDPPERITIGVLGDGLELPGEGRTSFLFLPAEGASEEELRAKVAAGELGPQLVIRSVDDVELVVEDETPA